MAIETVAAESDVKGVSVALDNAVRDCLLQLIQSPEASHILRQLMGNIQKTVAATSCLLLDKSSGEISVIKGREPGLPTAENHVQPTTAAYADWLQAVENNSGATDFFALDETQIQLIFPLWFEHRLCGGLVLSWQASTDHAPTVVQQAIQRICPVLAHMLVNINQASDQRRHDLYEERATISRELHDSLAQSLTYLKIQATRLDVALKQTDASNGKQAAQDVLAELRTNLNDAYRQLRGLMTTFRLTMHGKSFKLAVRDSIDEFNKYNNMVFELNDRCPADILTVEEEMQVLQIIREALYNIVKHSQAKTASVALHFSEPMLMVNIRDDGIGFEPEQKYERHHGLTIMQERAYHLGGKLLVRDAEPGGTEIVISFEPKSLDLQREVT